MNAVKAESRAAEREAVAIRQRADRELAFKWLAQRLWFECKVDIFKGVTMPAQRLVALRKLIADGGLADRQLGRFNDRPESYRQLCMRALGIDLDAAS